MGLSYYTEEAPPLTVSSCAVHSLDSQGLDLSLSTLDFFSSGERGNKPATAKQIETTLSFSASERTSRHCNPIG